MLTLLTATGCRPEAWSQCERWMMAQDYAGPVRWVIVDDGEIAQPVTFARAGWTVCVLRPLWRWQPGQNTQARNLAAGMMAIQDDARVVVIEDDDAYLPGYLSAVAGWLESADLVGECPSRYYNVATKRGRQLDNESHASLCSTAMKGPALSTFRQCLTTNSKFIDIELWRGFTGSKALHKTKHVIGIKGAPGRGGIGVGHKQGFGYPMDIGSWIGTEARFIDTIPMQRRET